MIRFEIPFFPPSTNKAYFHNHGKQVLAREGRAFKKMVTAHVATTYPRECAQFKKNAPYLVYLRIHLPSLENKGWPKKCDVRYKVFDSTNRVKLVEDALKDALGIDDSQHIAFLVHKVEDVEEKLEAFFWNLEEEVTPLDGFRTL